VRGAGVDLVELAGAIAGAGVDLVEFGR